MILEQLRSLSRARPFRPFVIHLADGRAVPVDHPELIAAVPNAETILVCQADESVDVIDLPQVTSLEVKALPGDGLRGRRGGE
jgi:hypothetical protein